MLTPKTDEGSARGGPAFSLAGHRCSSLQDITCSAASDKGLLLLAGTKVQRKMQEGESRAVGTAESKPAGAQPPQHPAAQLQVASSHLTALRREDTSWTDWKDSVPLRLSRKAELES